MYVRSEDCAREERQAAGGKGLAQMKILAKADQMYEKARLFNHVTLAPGCSIGNHVHEHETEFYYILKGEGVYNDNGTEVLLRPGDISETKHGQMHGIENRGSEPMEMIALIVTE